MNKHVKLGLFAISSILLFTVNILAVPVEIYQVELKAGINAYKYAAQNGWPVYYLSDNVALTNLKISSQNFPDVIKVQMIFKGNSDDLRWVYDKRPDQYKIDKKKLLFDSPGASLIEFKNIDVSMVKEQKVPLISKFSPIIIPLAKSTNLINPSLSYDADIATLTDLIDTAGVRSRVEELQAFNTRSVMAPNHAGVANWLKQQFIDMGITDVQIDSFIDASLSPTVWIKNVVATIPGTLDTQNLYVIGGHYDTSVWPYNEWAPGADDNGSGTTAALEAARILVANPPKTTVKFVAFDAEEWGLYGCDYFAANALEQGMKIACMFNFDMVGNLGNDSLFNCYAYDGSEIYANLSGQCATWYARTADTNLVPFYVNSNSNGSDSWSFFIRGFPVTYSEEYLFSPHWHLTDDSTTYMNMRYCTSVIKAGIGLLATMANYPQKVENLYAKDIGDGSQLSLTWSSNIASNVISYKISWGKQSGIYDDFAIISNTSYVISSLIEDSLYYVGVIAIDDQNRESPFISETFGTPKTIPIAPSNVTAISITSGITVSWQANTELDISGSYSIYRKINDGTYDSIVTIFDTTYVDSPLSGADKYYYKVRAYDNDGNYSPLSDSAYCRPITLDQGILVVDETQNWTTGSFPRDAQQDSFYNYILSDYKYEQYDYGSSLQKPILADYVPYTTVIWAGDDYGELMASGCMSDIRDYLEYGGKLWFAGWKPTTDIRSSLVYPADFASGSFLYDYTKVAHVEISGLYDSLQAVSGLKSYPDIKVDTLKYPSTLWGKTFRYIEALTPAGTGDTIYVIDMKNDASPYEGRACAVRDSGKTVFFGFPLYFMDKEQTKLAAQKVMAEFGEPNGVSTERPGDSGQRTAFRLYQNAPNPFSKQTTISYQLPVTGKVALNIYNITGQLVKTLINQEQPAGSYVAKWDGRDEKNRKTSAGVYIYHLTIGDKTQSRKMIVLK